VAIVGEMATKFCFKRKREERMAKDWANRDKYHPSSGVLEPRVQMPRAKASVRLVKDRYGEPERGNEWELIKILLEGDGNSNMMNTDSNTRLRLTTQIGQAHVATGVPLDLGTNTQPSNPRTQQNTKPRVH
jgi:hypothetical protein